MYVHTALQCHVPYSNIHCFTYVPQTASYIQCNTASITPALTYWPGMTLKGVAPFLF
jgi:hypothetical protein